MDDGAGAEAVSFRGLANSMDGSEGFCGEGSAMLLLTYQIQIINNRVIFNINSYAESMLCNRHIQLLYS